MAERGMRWVYVRVKYLPTEAALWRAQKQKPEAVDETTIRTADPKEIRAFFGEHFGGS